MDLRLVCLIFSIFVASCSAYLREWPEKITVTKENQHEFALPIGTTLRKDKRTKLYIPPPVTDDFDAEARLEVQWGNQVSRRNFCKVGPSIEGARIKRKFYWNTWCRNSDGEDVCCGKTRCSCNLTGDNCSCLSKEGFEYYEQKKQIDFANTLAGIDTVSNAISKVGGTIAGFAAMGK